MTLEATCQPRDPSPSTPSLSSQAGGYSFSTRGSMLLHAGAGVYPGPWELDHGSVLRITLGQISYVRKVSRISEIIGLVGGAMGIFITLLSFTAGGLETPRVQRMITTRRGAKSTSLSQAAETRGGSI